MYFFYILCTWFVELREGLYCVCLYPVLLHALSTITVCNEPYPDITSICYLPASYVHMFICLYFNLYLTYNLL